MLARSPHANSDWTLPPNDALHPSRNSASRPAAGETPVARQLRRGKDVDRVTREHDYSRDVLSRAEFFKSHGFADAVQ